MNYKKRIYFTIFISIVLAIIGIILALPENFNLCQKNDLNCVHWYIDNFNQIAMILFIFSTPIIILSVILLFLKEQVFKSWAKFAVWYLPISIIAIAFASNQGDFLFSSDKEILTFLLPIVFVIVSLWIMISKTRKL